MKNTFASDNTIMRFDSFIVSSATIISSYLFGYFDSLRVV